MDWSHKIKLKHILDDRDDLSEEEVQEKTNEFWQIIGLYKRFMEDFIDEYSSFYKEVDNIEEFNEMLSNLYDYCDWNSIWVE